MKARRQRNPLQKAIELINWMADHSGEDWGVRELAAACEWPPSTAHRVLRLLEAQGLIQASGAGGRYRLGLEFFRMAWRATSSFPIQRIALPLMRELVEACHETVYLALYDRVRMEGMFVAGVESPQSLRYVVEIGKWFPVYAGASGLGIMAFLPEEERREIAARTGLSPLTPTTITDPEALERETELIRRQGYYRSNGQRVPDAVGLAAPIWGPDLRVAGCLLITIPRHRFVPDQESGLARAVMEFARRITEQMGGRAPDPATLDGNGALARRR